MSRKCKEINKDEILLKISMDYLSLRETQQEIIESADIEKPATRGKVLYQLNVMVVEILQSIIKNKMLLNLPCINDRRMLNIYRVILDKATDSKPKI